MRDQVRRQARRLDPAFLLRSFRRIDRRTSALTIGAVLLALLAATQAVAQILQLRSPRVALVADPGNAVATAALADRRWMANPTNRTVTAQVADDARRSLQRMAFNPRALRLLGFDAELRGDAERARALMTLSDRMYRRDISTQLWLVESSVRAERLDQVLVHYDTALRVNAGAGDILFPILASALEDVAIQRALAPYLRPPAPWIVPFVRYATEKGLNLGPLSRTLARYGQVPALTLQTQLLGTLITMGRYDDAIRYFRTIRGAHAAVLTGVAFDQAHTDPNLVPVAWQPLTNGAAGVALETGGPDGRHYHIALPAEDSGTVLQKFLSLTPGSYRLSIAQNFIARDREAQIDWRLACLAAPAAGRVILDLPSTGADAAAVVVVPSDCIAQYLTLTASSGPGSGLDFYVERVALTRH